MKKNGFKILFRTAGGLSPQKEIGFGHVYRCISLAKTLKAQIFFLLEDFGSAKTIIKKNGFDKIYSLKPNSDVKVDIKKTFDCINKNQIDIIVIDRYNIKKQYLDRVKKICTSVVITDLNNYELNGDLIVNGFIGFKNKIVQNDYNVKCLLGPKFQILDNSFSTNKKKIKKEIDLLATFGGTDDNNISGILVDILSNYNLNIKVKIILGHRKNIPKNQIKLLKNLNPSISILNFTNNMRKEIQSSRFGLCSGGLTAYEFASQGIPFGIVCQNKHQQVTAQEFNKKGLAVNLGLINKKTSYRIKGFLEKIIIDKKNMKIPKKIIDGKGVIRVAREIKKLDK